jgi:GNAT superfamily N-acetyltransferase
MQEQHRTGIHYLTAATTLLHRIRSIHQTAGLLEAADLQWWWRAPRSTDRFPQLFWFDDLGRPVAGVITTDWGDSVSLDPIIMPHAAPDWLAHVVERGIAHACEFGFETLQVVVDSADHVTRDLLVGHGFVPEDDGRLQVVDAWLGVGDRPPVSSLHEKYRLCSRLDTMHRPHHMIGRNGPELEERLRQTSLYRPDLDLLVLDEHDAVAAYGLFWFDPDTLTGLVEPMRTENEHQRRRLAHHVLTAGIDRLANAGAKRIKLCFQPGNSAANALYLRAGFRPDKRTGVYARSFR